MGRIVDRPVDRADRRGQTGLTVTGPLPSGATRSIVRWNIVRSKDPVPRPRIRQTRRAAPFGSTASTPSPLRSPTRPAGSAACW
jgi:hypothetical protein